MCARLFQDVAISNRLKEVTHQNYKKIVFCHLDLQNFADIATFETYLLGSGIEANTSQFTRA